MSSPGRPVPERFRLAISPRATAPSQHGRRGVWCLRRFAADEPGPVLMFPAEDAGHIVRARLEGIAKAAGARFESLDIAVIDVPALRLDHRADRQRLVETVERIRPRLVVLDPLVRLHGVDENAVAEVAPMLDRPCDAAFGGGIADAGTRGEENR